MATVTQRLAGFNDDAVVFEVIITTSDFLTGNVTGFHAVSSEPVQCYGEIFLPNGTKKAASTCLPGTDTTVTLSGASRLAVTFDTARNRWVGIRGNFLGPANPLAVAKAARVGPGAKGPALVHRTYE